MKSLIGPLLGLMASVVLPGCLFAPRTELNAANAQNRALAEQNRAACRDRKSQGSWPNAGEPGHQ